MSSALNAPYPANILARMQMYRSYKKMKYFFNKVTENLAQRYKYF